MNHRESGEERHKVSIITFTRRRDVVRGEARWTHL